MCRSITSLFSIILLGMAIFVYAEPASADTYATVHSPIGTKQLRQMARRGDIRAQRMLADRYERGNGVARNYKLAARWYIKAAKRGDIVSQRNLGYLHETGLLSEQNYIEAEKWYRMAAEQGDPEAQRSLAYVYESGLIGRVDEAEAAKWRDRAAGRTVSEPAEEIAALKEQMPLAIETQPAEQGYSLAPTNASLSVASTENPVTEKPLDIGLTFNRHQPAAEDGDRHAQYRLGLTYLKGRGVRRDYQKAQRWLKAAAEGGYARAQAALGAMYTHGVGTEKNVVQAYFWFNLAESSLPRGRTQEIALASRNDAAQHMTSAQKAKAQQLARRWRTEIVPAMVR